MTTRRTCGRIQWWPPSVRRSTPIRQTPVAAAVKAKRAETDLQATSSPTLAGMRHRCRKDSLVRRRQSSWKSGVEQQAGGGHLDDGRRGGHVQRGRGRRRGRRHGRGRREGRRRHLSAGTSRLRSGHIALGADDESRTLRNAGGRFLPPQLQAPRPFPQKGQMFLFFRPRNCQMQVSSQCSLASTRLANRHCLCRMPIRGNVAMMARSAMGAG